MSRSFVSFGGVDAVVEDDALLVVYALLLERVERASGECSELAEVLQMGEAWHGMIGFDLAAVDVRCALSFCDVISNLVKGDVSFDELERVRERWFSGVRDWSEGIPVDLIVRCVQRELQSLCVRFAQEVSSKM